MFFMSALGLWYGGKLLADSTEDALAGMAEAQHVLTPPTAFAPFRRCCVVSSLLDVHSRRLCIRRAHAVAIHNIHFLAVLLLAQT